MSYTIERINNPPAILLRINTDFETKTEVEQYYNDLTKMLDVEDRPVSLIVDVMNYAISLEDLMSGTQVTVKSGKTPYKHPNVKTLVAITRNSLVKLSVDGLIKFGVIKSVNIVSSMDEALALLR